MENGNENGTGAAGGEGEGAAFNPLKFINGEGEGTGGEGAGGEGGEGSGGSGEGAGAAGAGAAGGEGEGDDSLIWNFDEGGEAGEGAGGEGTGEGGEGTDGEGGDGSGAGAGGEGSGEGGAEGEGAPKTNGLLPVLESLGIKVKDETEAQTLIKKIIADNTELRSAGVTNKKIDFYKKSLSLKDEELVKKVLEADGLEGELLEKALKKYKADGTLDIEAQMIRSRIRTRIDEEVTAEKKKADDEIAMRTNRQTESRKVLKDYLEKTDTKFGFKVVKDAKDLPKFREDMQKYIESGKLMDDILKDAESITDVAWFQRNKKGIIDALKNKGKQDGKKEIIENMGNHTKDDNGRIPDPDNKNTGFNPQKFMSKTTS